MVKDLKIFASDRMALLFSILFPFMFVILFNFILSGLGSQDPRLVINLATREPQGGMSWQIVSGLETKDTTALAPGQPEIVWLKDYDKAKQDVADGKISGFIAFPENFTEAVLMGYGTNLEVVYNAANTRAIAALNGFAQSISSQVGTQYVVDSAAIGLLVEKELAAPGSSGDLAQTIRNLLTGQGAQTPPPSRISAVTQKVGDVQAENPSNYVIPGYLVMFVFFTASFAGAQIVRERQNHTLERLLSTSATRTSVLGGMFAGTAAKGLIQIAIFWLVGVLAFKIDLGVAPAAAILLSIIFILTSSAFGLMLSTFAKTERAASSIGVLTSLILAPLGGCWWPLFITPQWMQFIAKFTPHGWATNGFNKLMVFGAGFGSVVPEMLVVLGFGMAFGAIAIIKFRTEAD